MSGENARRIAELETALRDVLHHIRPQGDHTWKLHTCLVTEQQVNAWWATVRNHLDLCDHAWQPATGHQCLHCGETTL